MLPTRPGMKRVAVDLSPLSPGGFNGGIKTALYATLRFIEGLPDCGLQLAVYARASVHEEIAPLLRNGRLFSCEEGEVPGSVDSADVCYCPVGFSTFIRAQKPTIALITDTLHRDHPYYLPADQVSRREVMCQETLQHVDRVQAISQWTANQVYHHFGFPAERVFVSRPLVHNRWAGVQEEPSGIPQPYFIYPANFWPHKNHETLLVAYRIYRENCGVSERPWSLILTGFPNDRLRYLQHITAVLRLDDVHFVGHVSEGRFIGLLRRAGAMIFPSLYEGLGLPLLEAMSNGCPVLTGDHAAIPETAGSAAMKTETRNPALLAESMFALASQPDLRAHLITNGLGHARACDPEIECAHLVRELRELAN